MQAGDGCPLFPKESVSAGKGEGDADDADGPVGRGGVTRSVNAEHPEDPGQMWMNTPHFTPKPGQSQSNHPTQLIGIRNPLDMKAATTTEWSTISMKDAARQMPVQTQANKGLNRWGRA